ncbi:MAG: ribose 5-phosphate isomerase B [Proteobacteria bacterium]|nr:ribose 5-phosphate isomerase B [Pseudomonadota bacterium]
MKKKIIIGSDHGGYDLKEILIKHLEEASYEVEDAGCFNGESVHYPEIAKVVASQISGGSFQQGILVCGTGIGMSIAANRFNGVRATLCHDHFTARMSREHNNSNILVLGGRVTGDEVARDILEVWLNTDFQGGRHSTRIGMFDELT